MSGFMEFRGKDKYIQIRICLWEANTILSKCIIKKAYKVGKF